MTRAMVGSELNELCHTAHRFRSGPTAIYVCKDLLCKDIPCKDLLCSNHATCVRRDSLCKEAYGVLKQLLGFCQPALLQQQASSLDQHIEV